MPHHPIHTARYTARYTNGQTAAVRPVDIALTIDGLRISAPDAAHVIWPYASIAIDVPVSKTTTRAVLFRRDADGATLTVDDAVFLQALANSAPHLQLGKERWRVAKPGLACGAVAASLIAAIYALDLSPSRAVARAMPDQARMVLGQNVVRTLPVQKTCTNVEGRAALTKIVARLLPNGPVSAEHIQVLDWQLVNALALPGKRIVLTRAIIEQAANAEELAGVIGHEAGHVASFDPEAGLVRYVGLWALVQMVFTGTPGALGNAGVVLAQLAYTRSAEREADNYALGLMRVGAIDPKPMAGFFRRMLSRRSPSTTREKPSESASKFPMQPGDILRSHPSDQDRIAYIEAVPTYPVQPILVAAEFAQLKQICASQPATLPPSPLPLPHIKSTPQASPKLR